MAWLIILTELTFIEHYVQQQLQKIVCSAREIVNHQWGWDGDRWRRELTFLKCLLIHRKTWHKLLLDPQASLCSIIFIFKQKNRLRELSNLTNLHTSGGTQMKTLQLETWIKNTCKSFIKNKQKTPTKIPKHHA